MPRSTIVSREDGYLHAEFRSFFFRFVDDVELLLLDDGELHVRSASRLGKGDFGVNAGRVEDLRSRLAEAEILVSGR